MREWELKSLGEIGEIITGKTPSTKDLDLWNGDIQFVTPTDITENKYQHSTERTIKKADNLKILPQKSIMFTCIASIGKMSLSLNPCVTNQQINSVIPHSCFGAASWSAEPYRARAGDAPCCKVQIQESSTMILSCCHPSHPSRNDLRADELHAYQLLLQSGHHTSQPQALIYIHN